MSRQSASLSWSCQLCGFIVSLQLRARVVQPGDSVRPGTGRHCRDRAFDGDPHASAASVAAYRSPARRSRRSRASASASPSIARARCHGIAASSITIDPNRLDDPAVWQTIPILDKDILRNIRPRRASWSNSAPCRIPRSRNSGAPAARPASRSSIRAPPRTSPMGCSPGAARFPASGIGKGDLVPYVLPDRHSSGGTGLGARRALVRCRHELGRRRQRRALGSATRPDRVAEADRVHRHVELRAASRQSRRSQGHRSRRLVGEEGGLLGRDAVAGQAREDRPHVGRQGLRRVRHERGRPDGRRERRP